jgi:hypothetical protein
VNAPIALLLGRFGIDQQPDLACHFGFDREVIAGMSRHRGDACFRLQADLDQTREGLRAIDCMGGRPGIDMGGQIGRKTDDVLLGLFRFRHGGTSERKAICTNISAELRRSLRGIKGQQVCQFGMLIKMAVLPSPRRCRYLHQYSSPVVCNARRH